MTEFSEDIATFGESESPKQGSETLKLFDNSTLLERVEKMGRALLVDTAFELDGEETRRYLRFTNGVFDAEKMTMF